MGYHFDFELFVKDGEWREPTQAELRALAEVSYEVQWGIGELYDEEADDEDTEPHEPTEFESSGSDLWWPNVEEELPKWSKAISLPVFIDAAGRQDGGANEADLWRLYAFPDDPDAIQVRPEIVTTWPPHPT